MMANQVTTYMDLIYWLKSMEIRSLAQTIKFYKKYPKFLDQRIR